MIGYNVYRELYNKCSSKELIMKVPLQIDVDFISLCNLNCGYCLNVPDFGLPTTGPVSLSTASTLSPISSAALIVCTMA